MTGSLDNSHESRRAIGTGSIAPVVAASGQSISPSTHLRQNDMPHISPPVAGGSDTPDERENGVPDLTDLAPGVDVGPTNVRRDSCMVEGSRLREGVSGVDQLMQRHCDISTA